jgi:hypothetical protein
MTILAQPATGRKPKFENPGAPVVEMPDGSSYTFHRLLMDRRLNAKLAKNGPRYLTLALALAPAHSAGYGTICSHASDACTDLCLNISGRTVGKAPMASTILNARIGRTRHYFQTRDHFLAMLRHELALGVAKAKRQNIKPIARLNVFSDIDWPRKHPDIIECFPEIQFYGYTKNTHAMTRFIDGSYPANYHLTFSRSETNEETALGFLERGANITVVFDTKYSNGHHNLMRPLPETWKGFPVVDGDKTDLRFLDSPGHVVGLRAKGLARKRENQTNGFVVVTGK